MRAQVEKQIKAINSTCDIVKTQNSVMDPKLCTSRWLATQMHSAVQSGRISYIETRCSGFRPSWEPKLGLRGVGR